MTDPTDLAALLETALVEFNVLLPVTEARLSEYLAARLAAAGVTVAPQPIYEPSCCELACYEDPGCACEGCTNPAEHLGPDDHGHTGRLWCDPCVGHGVMLEQGMHRCKPAPALDVERLARALKRMAYGGGSDAMADSYAFDVGFLTYSGEATATDLAAAIAREYAALAMGDKP